MSRGSLYRDGVKLQFSGHETFPLRYGWLKKAYDEVRRAEASADPSGAAVFSQDEAIARLGVGKNMVVAMRHWALASGIISEERASSVVLTTTALGDFLLDDDGGRDPWLERPASLWLLHWQFAGTAGRTTTWYYVFNHFPGSGFDREQLTDSILQLCEARKVARIARATVKRDVECFIRTYVAKRGPAQEDSLECPLSELSLVQPLGRRDGFQLRRGPKPTLPDGLFAWALCGFWSRFTGARTLSIEAVAHEPGSPGRVFQLDEPSLADRLARIGAVTSGRIAWSETAGLRQLIAREALEGDHEWEYLELAFPARRRPAEPADRAA